MNKIFFNSGIIFILWVLAFCKSQAQDTLPLKYDQCIDYLAYRRPAIIQDSTAKYGARLSAAEYLIDRGCNFVGQPFSSIESYFGPPNSMIDWSKNKYFNSNELTMKYLLFRPLGTSTTGMKWLYINCTPEYKILKLWIYTVDE